MTRHYSIKQNIEEWDVIPDLPPPLLSMANAKKHDAVKAAANIELDQPQNIARAIRYLKEDAPPAIEGHGGDACTFQIAAALRDLGISEGLALQLIAEHYNPRCKPAWSQDELATKVANAYHYAQNEAGAYAVPPVRERIPQPALDKLLAENAEGTSPEWSDIPVWIAKRHGYEPDGDLLPSYMGCEIATITPPRWLIKDLVPIPGVGLLFGKFGSFKTTGATDAGDAVLTGTKAFGQFEAEQGDVVLVEGEGLSGLKSRIEARAKKHGLSLDQYPLLLVAKVPRVDHPEEWAALIRTIMARGLKPKLIIIDHLSIMLSGQDQNDATVATQAMQVAHELANYFNCTVLILAHAGKEGDREVRGSSGFLDNADFAYELTRTDGADLVRVRSAKMRDGEAPEPFFLKAETRYGAAILTYADKDDARRASGKQVGLRPKDVALALRAMGACPGGVNEWTGKAGGISTKALAVEIARARHVADGDGLEPAVNEIDVVVAALNKGGREGGSLVAYVVLDRKSGRQWAIAPGPVLTEANHD